MDRLSFDDYFMVQVLWTRTRSQDYSTKCGCILVDSKNRIIGQGYNGHPRKVDFDKMPQDRPAKYGPIIHSENNAILNCTGSLDGATAYITGPPCVHCWAQMIQVGIKRVVYGPITMSSEGAYSKESKEGHLTQVVQDMLENHDVEIVRWKPQNRSLILDELDSLRQLVMITTVMDENRDLLKRLANN